MLQWVVAAAIVVAIPLLVRWGLGRTRGKAGAAALMLGLAFGHLFDPARAEATESLQKRREQGEAAGEEAGAASLGTSPKHLSE
ncbi:hypothetical protein CA234_04270 [Sphingomonas sp. ABOLE]|nr:hypothetical protein CA234_04270 [Sphingomonas sp. ABOLE]